MSIFSKKFWQKKSKEESAYKLDDFAHAAADFATDHKDALIIMGDPKTDVIFISYQGIVAPARILNRDGSRNFIVSNALRHGHKDVDIDRFLLAVDGGLYAIANTLYTMRKNSMKGKILDWVVGAKPPPAESRVKLADGSVLSPVQPIET